MKETQPPTPESQRGFRTRRALSRGRFTNRHISADSEAMYRDLSSCAYSTRVLPVVPVSRANQLHRPIGESPTYLNYAIWETSVAGFGKSASDDTSTTACHPTLR